MEDKCLFYIRYNSILNSENNIKNGTSNMEEWKKKEKKNLKAKEENICNMMKRQYNFTDEYVNKNLLIEYDINNGITSKLKTKINNGYDYIITRKLNDISENINSAEYIFENVKYIHVQHGNKKLYNLQNKMDKTILEGEFIAIDRKRKLLEKKNTNIILEKIKSDLIDRQNILTKLLKILSNHNMNKNILQIEKKIREKLNHNEIMMKYKINKNDLYINENTLKELNIILNEIDTLYVTYFIKRTKVLKYNLVDVDKIFNLYNEIRRFHYTFNKMFWNKYIY